MSRGLDFTSAAATQLTTLYTSPDVVAQRTETLRSLRVTSGLSVVDIGSGPGFLCESLADLVGPAGHVLGIDLSPDLVALSTRRNRRPWLAYGVVDATAIDAPSASFDVATCTQVAEYVPDVDKCIAECLRVLKPGGRAVFVATDWDGVIWHSDVQARMARVLAAWEVHCAHPRLPRTMASRLRAAGFALEGATVFPILNLRWTEDTYSHGIAQLIAAFVTRRSDVGSDEVAAWLEEFGRLDAEGRYFFSSSRFIFNVSKPF